MDDLVFREEVYAVVGAAIEVHRGLGAGFLEAVYQEAMDKLTGREEAQLINYLKSSGISVGVLINFGSHGKLEWRRLVKSQ